MGVVYNLSMKLKLKFTICNLLGEYNVIIKDRNNDQNYKNKIQVWT